MSGHLKIPAVLVPPQFRREVNAMSKAALADLAWDLCATNCASADDSALVIAEFRERRDAVLLHRKQARIERL